MAYFMLIYDVIDDYVNLRASFRERHLGYAMAAKERGELLLGGALANPVDKAFLLFRGPDRRVAEEFARNDPYVTNGLVGRWEVREWTVVIGNEAFEPK